MSKSHGNTYEYWQDVGNKDDFEKGHKTLNKRSF